MSPPMKRGYVFTSFCSSVRKSTHKVMHGFCWRP